MIFIYQICRERMGVNIGKCDSHRQCKILNCLMLICLAYFTFCHIVVFFFLVSLYALIKLSCHTLLFPERVTVFQNGLASTF